MHEILPRLWHWTVWHGGIGARVHSYYWEPAALLVDPMLPKAGLAWFRRLARPPRLAVLTNRHHYRHCGEFAKAFGVTVFCHRAGLKEFPRAAAVRGFNHGATLPGGVRALKVGVLCPEETALALPGGVLAFGDALIRDGKDLSFVPDAFMGPKPERVKAGLRLAFQRLARRPFRHLLFAHGAPLLDGGKPALRRFLDAGTPRPRRR
jgi:hypothetical protein